MKKVLLVLAILALSACASKKIIMKNCDKAGNEFFMCEQI